MNSLNSNNKSKYNKYTKDDLLGIINNMKKNEIVSMLENFNSNNNIIDEVIEKNTNLITKKKIVIDKNKLKNFSFKNSMNNTGIYDKINNRKNNFNN